MPLSGAHWSLENFTQKMTTKEWKQILLNEGDKIIFYGQMRILKARSLGCGVVEVYKMDIKKSDKILGIKGYK